MQIHLKSKYMDDDVVIIKSKYFSGGLALAADMADGSGPACKFSIYVEGVSPYLKENEFILKDYGENDGFLKALVDGGIVEDTGRGAGVGYRFCPVVRLIDPDRFEDV